MEVEIPSRGSRWWYRLGNIEGKQRRRVVAARELKSIRERRPDFVNFNLPVSFCRVAGPKGVVGLSFGCVRALKGPPEDHGAEATVCRNGKRFGLPVAGLGWFYHRG